MWVTEKLERTGTTSIDLDFKEVMSVDDFNDLSNIITIEVRVPFYTYEYIKNPTLSVKLIDSEGK